ncbi:MAG: hypothetical protein B7X98_01345 [Methylophilaceae bacterium 17-43-7]|nr:MAG: hypothetical protein B7X98_01345 [Methylophilaceae bacterium 17-43-7]
MAGFYSLGQKNNMPLVTSCPQCNTQFVVTKAQLKAYEGQVRCGTCQHVFNAKAFLIKQTRPKKSAPTKVEAVLSEISLNPDTQTDSIEHIEITTPAHLQSQLNEVVGNTASDNTEVATSNSESNESGYQTPSFLNDLAADEPVDKRWRRKHFSWPVFVACVLLFVMLLGQTIYHMRTEIAAHYPQAKPLLNQACQYLSCTVPLPQTIDLLTIDDSDMQEHLNYQHVLVFSSTLINHANFAQAYPNIELTLTNTEDELVLRRTFKGHEYLQNQALVNTGIGAKEEIRIKLHLNTTDIAVAGYRVSLTYR